MPISSNGPFGADHDPPDGPGDTAELTSRYRVWEEALDQDRPWLDLGIAQKDSLVVEYGFRSQSYRIQFPLDQLAKLANGFRINLSSPEAECVISHLGPSLGFDLRTADGHTRSFGISFLALRDAMRHLQ